MQLQQCVSLVEKLREACLLDIRFSKALKPFQSLHSLEEICLKVSSNPITSGLFYASYWKINDAYLLRYIEHGSLNGIVSTIYLGIDGIIKNRVYTHEDFAVEADRRKEASKLFSCWSSVCKCIHTRLSVRSFVCHKHISVMETR